MMMMMKMMMVKHICNDTDTDTDTDNDGNNDNDNDDSTNIIKSSDKTTNNAVKLRQVYLVPTEPLLRKAITMYRTNSFMI